MKIEGMPEGWELVAIRQPKTGENYLSCNGLICNAGRDRFGIYPIIRKIEKPKQYRQFANAEEFDQARHLLFRHKHKPHERLVAWGWNDLGIFMVQPEGGTYLLEWSACFARLEFDDGSPFGVEVTT